MMAKSDFVRQLTDMGYTVSEPAANKVSFDYEIPLGRFAGQNVKLGFIVADDFPLNPPGGPHFSPHLCPIGQNAIHQSEFGPDWQYWSRPFVAWNSTDHTVKAYFRHIKHLLHKI
jgi:hypothetical protein